MNQGSIYEGAELGTVPELNIFEAPLVQTGVLHTSFQEIRPSFALGTQSTPVEFYIGPNSANYIDLKRSRLRVVLKLVKEDGTDLDANAMVAPCNLILHSLWSQVQVTISNNVISRSNDCYPYKAYIQTLLKNNSEAKTSHLVTQGFHQDTGSNIDLITANAGALARKSKFAGSKKVLLEGPLLEDIMQIDRYLLNNCSIRIKLFRSKQPFIVLAEGANVKAQLELLDCSFKVAAVSVHPGIIQGHNSAFVKNAKAIYPYVKTDITTFNCAKGETTFEFNNLFSGRMPNKVIVCFVYSESFSGKFDRNPFRLLSTIVSEIELKADEVSVTGSAIKIDDVTDKKGRSSTDAYLSMMDTLNPMVTNNFGNMLDPEDFSKDNALYCFNVLGIGSFTSNFMQVARQANARITGRFAEPLTEAVIGLVYSEYSAVLEIDQVRVVKDVSMGQ